MAKNGSRPLAEDSQDPLWKVARSADALANVIGVAIEAGCKLNAIGEKLSHPLLRFADAGGRFGSRVRLDVGNTGRFSARLRSMPPIPNAVSRDPEVTKEVLRNSLSRLDKAEVERKMNYLAWQREHLACEGNAADLAAREADEMRRQTHHERERELLKGRLNGTA